MKMNTYIRKYLILIISLILFSCSTGKDYDKLFSKKNYENSIPFTLKFPGEEDRPVIKIRLKNNDFYMLVDTGSSINIMNSKGLDKLGISCSHKHIDIENIDFYADYDNYYTLPITETVIDGILGIPYLRSFGTVTIDYKRKVIIPNDIFNADYKMWEKDRLTYTDFYIAGRKTSGLIDTGSNGVVIREEDIDRDKYKKGVFFLKDTEFGGARKKYLLAVDNNPERIHGVPTSESTCESENIIGYWMFRNTVLHLDYENMLFQIEY